MIRRPHVVGCIWMALLYGCAAEPERGIRARDPAANESWQPLFNGRDLAGWEIVGAGDWTVEDREIVVRRKPEQPGAGWLVTEQDYGDFRLRWKFKTRYANFNSGVLIRDPGHAKIFRPAFNGYEIQIHNGEGESGRNTSGAIYDVARSYFQAVEPTEWHEFEVRCTGDYLVTYMDGEKMAEAHSRRSYKGGIGLQLHGGREETEFRWKDLEILELPQAPGDYRLLEEELEQTPGEFVDLFDGKDFPDVFDVYWDGGASWSLDNGLLRGDSPEEIAWIFTKHSYVDFVLALDFKISEGGNAGLGIRFPWPPDGNTDTGPASLGYECQILEEDANNPTGSIYNLSRAYTTDLWHRKIHRQGEWNHYRIYAKGDHIVTYVNRRKTAETHVDRSASGRIGFQVHEPAKWVEYRNVRIKVIR